MFFLCQIVKLILLYKLELTEEKMIVFFKIPVCKSYIKIIMIITISGMCTINKGSIYNILSHPFAIVYSVKYSTIYLFENHITMVVTCSHLFFIVTSFSSNSISVSSNTSISSVYLKIRIYSILVFNLPSFNIVSQKVLYNNSHLVSSHPLNFFLFFLQI